jgi:hypothetical protein
MTSATSGPADRGAAAAQLAALGSDRERLAERARQPAWHGPAHGLLLFLLFASTSTHDRWVFLAALVVFLAGLTALRVRDLRTTGIVLSGSRPGGSAPVVLSWAAGSVAVTAIAVWLEVTGRLPGAMAVGGALVGAGMALIDRWWNRRYVAALRCLP